MSKKQLIRIVVSILMVGCVSILLFAPARLRAVLHIPKKYVSLENKNSEILNLLPEPDDFSNDFSWSSVRITQFDFSYGESASSSLMGFYQGSEFFMRTQAQKFINATEVYESSVEADFSFPVTGELSNLQLLKISETQKFNCYYWIDDALECDVVIRYGNVVIGLEVGLDAGTDKSILEKLTNSALLAIQEDNE